MVQNHFISCKNQRGVTEQRKWGGRERDDMTDGESEKKRNKINLKDKFGF